MELKKPCYCGNVMFSYANIVTYEYYRLFSLVFIESMFNLQT